MTNDHAGEKELGMETWKDVAVEFWKHFQDPVLISGVIWGVLVGLPLSLWVYLKLTGRFGTTAEGRPRLLWVLSVVAVIGAYVAVAAPLLLRSGLRVIGQ